MINYTALAANRRALSSTKDRAWFSVSEHFAVGPNATGLVARSLGAVRESTLDTFVVVEDDQNSGPLTRAIFEALNEDHPIEGKHFTCLSTKVRTWADLPDAFNKYVTTNDQQPPQPLPPGVQTSASNLRKFFEEQGRPAPVFDAVVETDALFGVVVEGEEPTDLKSRWKCIENEFNLGDDDDPDLEDEAPTAAAAPSPIAAAAGFQTNREFVSKTCAEWAGPIKSLTPLVCSLFQRSTWTRIFAPSLQMLQAPMRHAAVCCLSCRSTPR